MLIILLEAKVFPDEPVLMSMASLIESVTVFPTTSMFYAMHRPPNNDILKQQENASTIAGGNPNATNYNFGVNPNPNTNNLRDDVVRVYLEESNLTKTVADLFVNNSHNITWKYYDHLV